MNGIPKWRERLSYGVAAALILLAVVVNLQPKPITAQVVRARCTDAVHALPGALDEGFVARGENAGTVVGRQNGLRVSWGCVVSGTSARDARASLYVER